MVGEFSIGFTQEAQADIDFLLCQYDVRNPRAGKGFSYRLEKALYQLSRYPESAPIIAGNVRRMVLLPLPFALYYSVLPSKGQVLVGAILHVHQHPDNWKDRTF